MAYTSDLAPNGANDDGSLEALLTPSIKKKPDDVSGPVSQPLAFRNARSFLVHALLLLFASTFFALWINSIRTTCPLDPLLTYSPVNEAVEYLEKKFDGSLDSTSIFRGYPSPVIDAAWKSVSVDNKVARLTREQFLKIGGKDITATVKFRPEDGGGYMTQIDGYHHIHCLDLLRKYLRRDYYASFDESFNDKLRPHLGHCVEIIRQKLMCTSDLTMASYDWVPGLDSPSLNLSTIHQCVDYQRILDWSFKHNAHVQKGHVVKFGDATELLEEVLSEI